ncbi:unnamed protein product [Mytilus edulis]|uniref:COR domain-containing protein n=1 Tax=Mytilus edulis TaxID=6550 RepID=A0A8S3TVJ7_MYTED|nr:unnamed protein product [Mytilus edulis]
MSYLFVESCAMSITTRPDNRPFEVPLYRPSLHCGGVTTPPSVLPEAINQLSEEDILRFNKLMQSSQTENRYFVRIMLVGKESVGKTCLLRRLLKENISDVTSTDGVDIVVRRCKINLEDGKWKIEEEYVDFWFDSIHCHRTADDPKSEHFDPPIILVFTGKDKCDKEYIPKRIEKLDDQLDKVLGYHSKHHHLHDKFYLSNTEDHDNAFQGLRTAIFDTARKMNNWGQALPMKWILLEYLIEINKDQGRNFVKLTDMIEMGKHPDINIIEKEDLLVFLRFQHNIGNIIFFENIPDLIILKPQWLADAFRCLVSNRIEAKFHHLSDYKLLKNHDKISKSLISKLFESKKGSQFLGQQGNLHQLMEKLDIIVKVDTDLYIMPSNMPASAFEDVCKNVGIRNTDCKRTSWLCLKFDFLPPSFFNHLSAWFIRNYNPSKLDSDNGSFALYRGICMFDIDSSGCVKILVTMSTDIIALQVVSFSKQRDVGKTCNDIYNKVKDVVEKIRKSYKVKISFKLHFKCSDGDYYKDTIVYETLSSQHEYYCPQHKTAHQSDLIYSPWLKNEYGFLTVFNRI